jgi:hypothetical protein
MVTKPVCHPRARKEAGICDREPDESLESYDDVVDHYIRNCLDGAQEERHFFNGCSLKEAIRYAGMCMRPDKKRHSHHLRRSTTTLAEAESVLQECANELRACETFDELHSLIHSKIHPINGIGPLVVYDVATWIGACRGLHPDRVYLHSGTAKGARAMVPILGRKTISRSELPAAFRRLRCCEIEDCLCTYADDLARIETRLRQRTNACK